MSQAFMREGDEQSLNEIPPTMTALVRYLTMENNGVRVYEQKSFTDDTGRYLHVMSNGMSYFKNTDGKWEAILSEL